MIDEAGAVIGPPTILRASGSAPAPELEREALRAMAGCAPYVAAPPGRYRSVELDFSRQGDIAVPGEMIEVR